MGEDKNDLNGDGLQNKTEPTDLTKLRLPSQPQSPDGRWLAFYRGQDSLVVLPSAGGEPREVVDMKGNAGNTLINLFIRWTPDGEHLLFCRSYATVVVGS